MVVVCGIVGDGVEIPMISFVIDYVDDVLNPSRGSFIAIGNVAMVVSSPRGSLVG